MSKKIIVTGSNGQDGSYMCEYLLENTDYEVLGATRRTSQPILKNLEKCLSNPRFRLVPLELTDANSISSLIKNEKPDYFINFGASSFVADSWNQPAFTMEVNSSSLIHILEAVKDHAPNCRVYSSGSSEQWGDVKYSPQDEKHPMSPRSIYGVSKCAASHICKIYRESYGLYVIHGILCNHESPRRQLHFISKKITHGVARIYHSIKNNESFEPISCGNVMARRDWSHSKDFVDGIWKMINQDKSAAKEYVLSSDETFTVKYLIETAFKEVGIIGEWAGNGVDEKFVIKSQNINEKYDKSNILILIDKKYFRPADVELLCGDSTLARKELKWQPKYTFESLIKEMVNYDIDNYVPN